MIVHVLLSVLVPDAGRRYRHNVALVGRVLERQRLRVCGYVE